MESQNDTDPVQLMQLRQMDFSAFWPFISLSEKKIYEARVVVFEAIKHA